MSFEPTTNEFNSAFWNLTNSELDATAEFPVDCHGNVIPHCDSQLDRACYFALQRADDPGVFHYSLDNA